MMPEIARTPDLIRVEVPDRSTLVLEVQETTRPHESERQRFEIRWDSIVCFAVRGDPFFVGESDGTNSPTVAEKAAPNNFLNWVEQSCATDADYIEAVTSRNDRAGRVVRHWRVLTEESYVDVASLDEPIVRLLDALEVDLD